jgi:hypothetical protein
VSEYKGWPVEPQGRDTRKTAIGGLTLRGLLTVGSRSFYLERKVRAVEDGSDSSLAIAAADWQVKRRPITRDFILVE